MGNGLSLYVILMLILLAHLWPDRTVAAFHSGSSGECKECHEGNDNKLRGSDASSTCLRCHEAPRGDRKRADYYVATNGDDIRGSVPPSQMTPGGDFGYLKKNYRWSPKGKGREQSSSGDRHGHNIVAMGYGYMADRTFTMAPGGSYPASELSCVSCHDPHAKIDRGFGAPGAYRLLGSLGYTSSSAKGMAFTVSAPVAVAPRDYNRPEARTSTRVAYGKGMSEWCSNCHPNGCSGAYGHPTCSGAKCGKEISVTYNAYVKSGDINGRANASYTSLVPFEEGIDDRASLSQHANSDGSFASGPNHSANVMCLTCHRAHASGWDRIARWNMSTTFIVHNGAYPGTDNGAPADHAQGRTSIETQRAYYDRPSSVFASHQRGLCNKCHARD